MAALTDAILVIGIALIRAELGVAESVGQVDGPRGPARPSAALQLESETPAPAGLT